MKGTTKVIALALVLFSQVAPWGWAEEFQGPTVLSYANDLARRHQFKASAEEYTRALWYFPALRQQPELFRSALRMAEASEDYPYAVQLNSSLRTLNGSLMIGCLCDYYSGRLLYRMEKYEAAMNNLTLSAECPGDTRHEADYYRGLSMMRLGQWDAAERTIQSLQPNALEPALLQKAQTAIREGRQENPVSPSVAATFSVILPGSGYAYARQPKSALAALVTTGLLAWGSVSAFHKDETGVGVLLGVFGTGWYFGGIYGSARAADRYNHYRSDKLLSPLEQF